MSASTTPLQPTTVAKQFSCGRFLAASRHLLDEFVADQLDHLVEGCVHEGHAPGVAEGVAPEVDDGACEKAAADPDGEDVAAVGVEGEQVRLLPPLLRRTAFSRLDDHAFLKIVLDDFVDSHLRQPCAARDLVDRHRAGVAQEIEHDFPVVEFQRFQGISGFRFLLHANRPPESAPGVMEDPGRSERRCYRSTRAPPPPTSFSTSAFVAIVVSPGVVMASAPCAAP